MITAGMPTTRRAAFDLGGPRLIFPPGERRSLNACHTRTLLASRSSGAAARRRGPALPAPGSGLGGRGAAAPSLRL